MEREIQRWKKEVLRSRLWPVCCYWEMREERQHLPWQHIVARHHQHWKLSQTYDSIAQISSGNLQWIFNRKWWFHRGKYSFLKFVHIPGIKKLESVWKDGEWEKGRTGDKTICNKILNNPDSHALSGNTSFQDEEKCVETPDLHCIGITTFSPVCLSGSFSLAASVKRC